MLISRFVKLRRKDEEEIWRISKGIYAKSLKKLCDEIRISTAYLSDTENGNRFPSKEKLDEFIKAFNLKDDEEDRFYDLVSKESPNKYKVS